MLGAPTKIRKDLGCVKMQGCADMIGFARRVEIGMAHRIAMRMGGEYCFAWYWVRMQLLQTITAA